MERTLEKPLNEQDLQDIKKALQDTIKLDAAINKAKSAGIDVGDSLAQNAEKRKRLQQYLNTYFPGQ